MQQNAKETIGLEADIFIAMQSSYMQASSHKYSLHTVLYNIEIFPLFVSFPITPVVFEMMMRLHQAMLLFIWETVVISDENKAKGLLTI